LTIVCAIATHEKVWIKIDNNSITRNALSAIMNMFRIASINGINTGNGNVLFPVADI
jgi:hypothetical protein